MLTRYIFPREGPSFTKKLAEIRKRGITGVEVTHSGKVSIIKHPRQPGGYHRQETRKKR